MSTAIWSFWNNDNKCHTFHPGDSWPVEVRQNVQFYAFATQVAGSEPVFDFWNEGEKFNTFHMGEAWPNEVKGNLQFYAFPEQKPGTEVAYDYWNSTNKEHTFHFGAPWPDEVKCQPQYWVYTDQLTWNEHAKCDGASANDRAKWIVDNKGLTEEAAKEQVMSEFPAAFSKSHHASGGHSVDGLFPHTLKIVQDSKGKNRLQIAVTPSNPDEVTLIAVHYGIDSEHEGMNFDINHPVAGTSTYVHVTPDFGPECNPGSSVKYWIAGVVKGLIQEMPHGACPNPAARLHWNAH